ncbi:MAG: family 31 glucosidase [Clostridia bacterium]|nr:family 31 glucosidase [Clostridia bacterium]
MRYTAKDGVLTGKSGYETLRIEAFGRGLRVRATVKPVFSAWDKALCSAGNVRADVRLHDGGATVTVGALRCEADNNGMLSFYKGDTVLLREYYRDWRGNNAHSPSMKVTARAYTPITGSEDVKLAVRFEADEGEKVFGMGQYQQPQLDLKGCVLELAQRNSQASVPFYLSNRGYGFLWNNPAVGEAVFGANYTQFSAQCTDEADYWITAGDTPKEILYNFTDAVGRAPRFPADALGLWQCKLRYRTQEELLAVAREYKRRGIPLDVIMIDFFHWPWQGDWRFDQKYWPDPQGMMDELRAQGTRCMVSVWPTVDRRSENYADMREKGLLVRTDRGSVQTFDFQGDTCIYDATNPEARNYIWQKVKNNYYRYGIDVFWLDESEPEYSAYDFDHYRYHAGPALKVSNAFPMWHVRGFYEHQRAEGQENIVNLTRCAWVGSQKYGVVVWSGDIKANFASMRDQLAAGLNIGIAGIPWWNSDTGGFFGNVTDEHFTELLIRWFQFAAFCPILRMHGDREPHDIPPLTELDHGGGFCFTGRPNELWSFGEQAYTVMKKYLDLRLSMKEYIQSVMDEASENGSPVIRPMFYEFPEDPFCWDIADQYMFGGEYLVAPVLYEGMRERQVYLPQGKWQYIHDNVRYNGGQTVTMPVPLDVMPVFRKIK